MILTALASFVLISAVAFADNDCNDCDSMLFTANGGLEIEYSRYMGEWMKVDTWDGRPLYACPGMDCQGLDRMMAWIDNQALISYQLSSLNLAILCTLSGKQTKYEIICKNGLITNVIKLMKNNSFTVENRRLPARCSPGLRWQPR